MKVAVDFSQEAISEMKEFRETSKLDGITKIQESDVSRSYYGDYSNHVEHEMQRSSGEVALWRMVVLQRFIDAKSKSNDRKNIAYRQEARAWLKYNRETLKMICMIAHLPYNLVKKQMPQSRALTVNNLQ